jgi:hypothetical protein
VAQGPARVVHPRSPPRLKLDASDASDASYRHAGMIRLDLVEGFDHNRAKPGRESVTAKAGEVGPTWGAPRSMLRSFTWRHLPSVLSGCMLSDNLIAPGAASVAVTKPRRGCPYPTVGHARPRNGTGKESNGIGSIHTQQSGHADMR